jgi:autotransporter family porin
MKCRGRCRRLLSSGGFAVAVSAVVAFDSGGAPALAQTCTPAPPNPDTSGNATCTAGTYNSNINYNTNNTPINLTLLLGVHVVIPAGAPGINAVNAANTTGVTLSSANISIVADGLIIDNTNNPLGNNQTGLRIQSSGDAVITATSTTINVNGTASEDGIVTFAMPNMTGNSHVASVTWSGPGITSSGTESTGIQADNRGIGNATIVASGNITVTPGVGLNSVYGLIAHSGDSLLAPSGAGDASVTYHNGTINAFGDTPRGIVVWAEGDGSATLTTDPGTVIMVSGTNNPGVAPPTLPVAAGIALQLDQASAANGRAITANVASTITNFGAATPGAFFRNPTGIRALSFADAPITLNYTGPGVTTQGGGGAGIMALSGSGSITVNASGPINTTDGSNAVGILADSGTILAQKSGLLTDTTTIRQGGVLATSTTGSVLVNAVNVSAQGQFGTAISATSGIGGVKINIAQGGSIMGGWQADLASVGPTYGLQATGIFLGSAGGAATLTNFGSIGALSDRAVAGSPLFPSNTSIFNNGDVTGFVQLVGGNNLIVNDGTFNLRHFADTTGALGGVRDTVRVAIADLGAGPNNRFTNNGTLALPAVTGATALDSTGQYLPLGNPNDAMVLNGPLQGHLIGVNTFTNSGTIDLQSNPAAGDVLVITGARQAGVAGTGSFVSNGGTLKLDTVLNEGGPVATRSDTLVVDGTKVGSGATSMQIRNAGGAGALTVGDGILVVQVLDPSRSQGGVFTLGAPAVAGPYEYTLFLGGVGGDAKNGNWYLRSMINCALEPNDPACSHGGGGQIPNPPIIPDFRQETSLYAAIPSLTLLYGRTLLDSLHERVGEEEHLRSRGDLANGAFDNGGWARVIGLHGQRDGDVSGIFGAGPKFDYDFVAFQGGHDLYRAEHVDGSRDHIGFSVAAGLANSNVTHFNGVAAGTDQFTAASVSGYWTHFGPSGWYLDGVLQGTWYDAHGDSHRGLGSLSTSGPGFAASLEGGYPFHLGGGWKIEPQAQIVYQTVGLSNGADSAATVSFQNVDSLAARIGARFAKTWLTDDGPNRHLITAWIRPNLWREFLGNPLTEFSSETGPVPFRADLGGYWAEINVGVSATLNRTTELYGNGSVEESFDGRSFSYNAKLGMRINW